VLDSRNENLPEKRIHRNYAGTPGRETAIDLAKGGDLAALRMCMDRLVPARKHEPVAFELPRLDTAADTVTAASTIVAAVAAGELAPSEAADIAKAVDIYVRALATQQFEERLAKLERGPAPAGTDA
jgi:hypothetical protein